MRVQRQKVSVEAAFNGTDPVEEHGILTSNEKVLKRLSKFVKGF